MAQDTSIKDWYTGRPYSVCMMHTEDKNRNGYLKSLSSNPIGWFYAILQDFIELLGNKMTFTRFQAATWNTSESLMIIIENNSGLCIGKNKIITGLSMVVYGVQNPNNNNKMAYEPCLCKQHIHIFNSGS